jgi:hypothetical protein
VTGINASPAPKIADSSAWVIDPRYLITKSVLHCFSAAAEEVVIKESVSIPLAPVNAVVEIM